MKINLSYGKTCNNIRKSILKDLIFFKNIPPLRGWVRGGGELGGLGEADSSKQNNRWKTGQKTITQLKDISNYELLKE